MAMRFLLWMAALASSEACSHFVMNYTSPNPRLSVRSMDLSSTLDWVLHSVPRGQDSNVMGNAWRSKYGYVGFSPSSVKALGTRIPLDGLDLKLFSARDVVSDGLNEQGLSCGFLTLIHSQFQKPHLLQPHRNLLSYSLCKWALENFDRVSEVEHALPGLRVFFNSDIHFALTDAAGDVIVIEFLAGKLNIHRDSNDGVTGFGILTNEPEFSWQTRSVQQLVWKQSLARSAVSIPGNFYPDERFLRVHLIKDAIERTAQPSSYREAVARAVAIMNTVTVPMGDIPGTDSGSGSGEGDGDHTQWAVIRDHAAGNSTYYLRSQTNPSWRRLRLSDLDLSEGAPVKSMVIEQGPWFVDASTSLV